MADSSKSTEGQKERHLEEPELIKHAHRLLGEYTDELRAPDIASQVPDDYLNHDKFSIAERFRRTGAEWFVNYYKMSDPNDEMLMLQRFDEKDIKWTNIKPHETLQIFTRSTGNRHHPEVGPLCPTL